MQSRTILITAGAAVAAFAVAFGIGKATSGSEASTADPGKAAETFEVSGASISAATPKAGLPTLKPKPTPEPTATPDSATTPDSTTPVNPTVPETTTTTPPPPPTEDPVSGGEEPVSGGGEG